jgi:hypothetical protein
MRPLFLVLLALTSSTAALGTLAAGEQPKTRELPLLFVDDFGMGADAWEPTDPKAWKLIDVAKGKAFSQFQQSKYKPPFRSPLNIALRKGVTVGDFVLEALVKSTVKDYPHRDVCLFFGYQDPSHFYYAHLAKRTDDRANQIFLVNGADRKKISTKTTEGTPWDDKWHLVKVVRTVGNGKIEVYFDDMRTPVMTATDRTLTWGRVGIGSFDDTGDWMDVSLRGVRAEKK